MANVPKRQHYTPKFYLEGFTDSGDLLHIVQRDTGRRWTSRAANTGLERDFYTLEDIPTGEDPYFIEKAFAQFEGQAAAVLGEIITNRTIPKDTDKYDTLINFIALAAARVPGMRRLISKPMEEIAQMMAQMMVSSKERFEQSFPEASAQGLTYETAREFVQHGMVIETTTAAYVNHLLSVVEILLPVLGNRNWTVCYNDTAGEHFIVTDSPVAVTWSDTRPAGFFGPAFGKSETDVTVPLSSHVALIGRFEDVPETLALSKQGVAAVNNKTLAYSSRFIAACDDDFLIDTLDRGIVGSKEMIEQIEKWAAEREKKT
jgi:hypothetical protein